MLKTRPEMTVLVDQAINTAGELIGTAFKDDQVLTDLYQRIEAIGGDADTAWLLSFAATMIPRLLERAYELHPEFAAELGVIMMMAVEMVPRHRHEESMRAAAEDAVKAGMN